MEEKEKYIILSGRQIKDTQNQSQEFLDIETVCRLLNQQDKRIKELEEENKVGEFWHSAYQGKQLEYDQVYAELRKAYEEVEQLKQKAIVPKFMVGQEVYIINKEYYYKKHWCVEKHKIVGIEDKIDRKEKYVRWYTLTYGDIKLGNRYKFQEKDVFTTKEEAEQKLAEIRGKDE